MTLLLKPSKKREIQIVTRLYEVLDIKKLIRPGSTIEGKLLEEIIGVKYAGGADWRLIGPYLGLKMRLESEGYFVTQKDIEPPGFRILKTEEMAEHALNKLMDNLASNYNIACVMANHDVSKLSEIDMKKHKNVQQKATQTAMLQHKMIMDQQFF